MVVRAAEESDAPGIGLVHVRSWQAAYRGHFPKDFLDGLEPPQRAAYWQGWFRDGPHRDRASLLVCELDGTVVGFTNVGPSRDEDSATGEVRALYLLPERWGQGLGRELMTAGLQALVSAGFREATLWVLDANVRARRFYESAGWTADGGAKEVDPFGFPISEVRYRTVLR